jgi:hypothetical protein
MAAGRSTGSLERMRNVFAMLAGAIVSACVGTPHNDPSEISALEVSVAKTGMEMGCRDQGRGLGHPPDQVERRCKCVLDTLNAKLTEEEWKRFTFYAQQKRDRDQAEVIAPHMSSVRECK